MGRGGRGGVQGEDIAGAISRMPGEQLHCWPVIRERRWHHALLKSSVRLLTGSVQNHQGMM